MKNLLLLLPFLFSNCSSSENDPDASLLFCTEIFITATIEVTGSTLDHYFSLRLSNGDTLRINDYDNMDNHYPIINDSSIPQAKGTEERIDFVAIRGNETRKTPYTFTSDGCHIIKLSGLDVIDF